MLDASQKNVSDGERAAKQMEEYAVAEVQRDRAEKSGCSRSGCSKSRRSCSGAAARAGADGRTVGAKRVSTLMAQRVKRLDEEAQRSKELVYTSDFQPQLMERKVARVGRALGDGAGGAPSGSRCSRRRRKRRRPKSR